MDFEIPKEYTHIDIPGDYLDNLTIASYHMRVTGVSNEKIESRGWRPLYDLDYGIKQLMQAYQMTIIHNNRNFTNL